MYPTNVDHQQNIFKIGNPSGEPERNGKKKKKKNGKKKNAGCAIVSILLHSLVTKNMQGKISTKNRLDFRPLAPPAKFPTFFFLSKQCNVPTIFFIKDSEDRLNGSYTQQTIKKKKESILALFWGHIMSRSTVSGFDDTTLKNTKLVVCFAFFFFFFFFHTRSFSICACIRFDQSALYKKKPSSFLHPPSLPSRSFSLQEKKKKRIRHFPPSLSGWVMIMFLLATSLVVTVCIPM